MKNFSINNLIIFGDSCSGKTFFYNNIFIKKIDSDFFLNFKKINFFFEYFYRKFEFLFIYFKKNFFFFSLAAGFFLSFSKKNFFNLFLIYKNILLFKQIKNFIFENNRPIFYNYKIAKIRYCLRKKKYIKIKKIFLNKCFFCNLKKI